MDVVDAKIKVDHAGTMLHPGDDVRIQGLQQTVRHHGKKTELSHFNGLVGTVLERQQDGDARVCVSVHGLAGKWDLPVEALTLQPLGYLCQGHMVELALSIGREVVAVAEAN